MANELRLRVILDAIERVTRPLKAISAESKKTTADLRAAQGELRKLDHAQKDLADFRKLREGMRGAGNEIAEATRKAKALKTAIDAQEAPTRRMNRAYESARKEISELVAKQQAQIEKARVLKDRLREAGVSVVRLGQAESALKSRMGATNVEIDRQKSKLGELAARQRRLAEFKEKAARANELGGKIRSAGTTAVVGGVIGLAGLAAGAKPAIDFESAMADVKKVLPNEVTAAQVKTFSDELLELSRRLPVSATGLATIASEAARAGVAFKDLGGFTSDAAKMKVAFDFEDDQQAGATMAAWRNAFGFRQDQIRKLADQINALTNWKGGHANDVADIVTRVGPIAGIAGAGTDLVAALGERLSSKHVEVEVASTGIKNLMLQLTRGSSATPKMRKAMAGLGLEAEQLAKSMQIDARGTLLTVLEKISKLPKDKQISVMVPLFGKESIESVGSLLTDLPNLRAAFDMVGRAQAYAGSMDKEYAARAATTANALQLAKNNALQLSIIVGTTLLPTIVKGARWLGDMVHGVTVWAKAHPGLSKAIAITAGAVAALMMLTGSLAVVIGSVLGPIALMRLAFAGALPALTPILGALGALQGLFTGVSVAIGSVGGAALATFGAIGLVIVGALVGIVLAIRKYWGPISAFFSGFAKGVADGLAPLAPALRPIGALFGFIARMIGSAWAWFTKLIEPVKASKTELAEAAKAGQNFGLLFAVGLKVLFGPITWLLTSLAEIGRLMGVVKGGPGKIAVPAAPTTPIRAPAVGSGRAGAAAAAPPVTVHVHGATDPHAVGRAVRAELDKHARAQSSRARSAYADTGA